MDELEKVKKEITLSGYKVREFILSLESEMFKMPGAMIGDCCPLTHNFAEGLYIRQITMPKGVLFITKIHRYSHAAFILRGDVSILEESGMRRVKAPASFITPAGTKRIVVTNEETVWTTVHSNPNNYRDVDKIEEEIIAKSFNDIETIIKVEVLK